MKKEIEFTTIGTEIYFREVYVFPNGDRVPIDKWYFYTNIEYC